jgi:hypothetical protein
MFKGQFKFKNATGVPYTYSNGDVVVYDGKVYKALTTTQLSPLQGTKDWIFLNLSQPYKGTNPPVNPKENQFWISDDGIMYVYFYDGNSYQWIST